MFCKLWKRYTKWTIIVQYYKIFCVGICYTEHGAECKFPFKYKNIEYNECTNVDDYKPWCATQIDPSGNYIDGAYGYCDQQCLKGISKLILGI